MGASRPQCALFIMWYSASRVVSTEMMQVECSAHMQRLSHGSCGGTCCYCLYAVSQWSRERSPRMMRASHRKRELSQLSPLQIRSKCHWIKWFSEFFWWPCLFFFLTSLQWKLLLMFVKGAKMGRRLGSQEWNQARHTNVQILPFTWS